MCRSKLQMIYCPWVNICRSLSGRRAGPRRSVTLKPPLQLYHLPTALLSPVCRRGVVGCPRHEPVTDPARNPSRTCQEPVTALPATRHGPLRSPSRPCQEPVTALPEPRHGPARNPSRAAQEPVTGRPARPPDRRPVAAITTAPVVSAIYPSRAAGVSAAAGATNHGSYTAPRPSHGGHCGAAWSSPDQPGSAWAITE